LTTHPSRTTWFQPSPRSFCSVDGPARWALGAAEWLVVALLGHPVVLALQGLPSLLSTLYSPCNSLCGCPCSSSTESAPAGLNTHRRCGSHHTRRTGAHIRSYAACVRSAGSACIAAGPLEPRTTPQTLADRIDFATRPVWAQTPDSRPSKVYPSQN
jgi:hypothetical protein